MRCRKKPLLVCLCLWVMMQSLGAQEEFIEPQSTLLTRIPFRQLTGGVILLKAQFADYLDTLNFILDTGSGGISLDSTTADFLGVQSVPSDKTIRGIGGIRNVNFVYGQKLRLPGLEVDSLDFHINDYTILSSVYGEPIDGIIGYAVFSKFIVRLDYDSSYAYFYTPGTFKYPRGGYLLKPFITSLVVQSAKIRDERAIYSRFLYDIGAGLCLMLSEDFVNDSTFLSKKKKFYVKQAQGVGGIVDMKTTFIKEFRLGPYRFRKVPVYVFKDEYNITSYPYLAGILGNDILRRFNAIINYPNRDIYLVPNSHFTDLFDYSYSGVELYLVDNEIIIGDLAPGSPGEASGLKEGDVVIAVDRLFNHSLQEYKAALQQPGKRVKVIVRRNDKLEEFDIKVKSILSRR